MDLVWLVYAISLLHGFGTLLIMSAIVSGFFGMCFLIYRGAECSQESWHGERECQKRAEKGKWAMGHVKTCLKVFILSAVLATLLPTEKTAYMMVGAYATQKIAENDKVQETGGKVLQIINQKLDQYVEEGIAEAEKQAERATKSKK